jgi:hypothetical protein
MRTSAKSAPNRRSIEARTPDVNGVPSARAIGDGKTSLVGNGEWPRFTLIPLTP